MGPASGPSAGRSRAASRPPPSRPIGGLVAAADTVVTTTAAADGAWSVEVPVQGGTIVLDAVATSPQGATAHVQRTVVFDVTPGEVLLDVTDPDGDDNGPGNYAYPTSPTSGRAPTTSSGSRSSTTVPT